MSYVIRILNETHVSQLLTFFIKINIEKIVNVFHPHEFTLKQARKCCRGGKDLYCAMFIDEEIVAYGMLRGWEVGFEIPSLGIIISPKHQGKGLGNKLMRFLHTQARRHGSKQIRLTVHENNSIAIKLYTGLGYKFKKEEGRLVGLLDL